MRGFFQNGFFEKRVILLSFCVLPRFLLHFKKLKWIFQFLQPLLFRVNDSFGGFSFAGSILGDHPFVSFLWLIGHLSIILYDIFLTLYILTIIWIFLSFIDIVCLFLFKSFLSFFFRSSILFLILLFVNLILKIGCWEGFFQKRLAFTRIYTVIFYFFYCWYLIRHSKGNAFILSD
jgi:hypothetical protein